MDLRLLPTFVAVAECRHFGRAASMVNLSQPAVSHQIAQLEEALGARLLNRDGRRVTLTVAGEALLDEARAILEAASRAEGRIRDVASGAIGRVRIGASATAAFYLLPAVLAGYRLAFPRFDCRLTIGDTPELEKSVIRNELDMAVVAASHPQRELRAVELAPDAFVLIASAEGVPAIRTTSAALSAQDWIVREEGADARNQTVAWLERRNITPARLVAVNGPAAVIEAVSAGLGVALVSRAAADAAAGRVTIVRAGAALPARAYWLIDYPHKHHGAACQAMLAALTSCSLDRPPRSRR